jgi:hypothetical protein
VSHVMADRVWETTTTTGTGAIALGGAAAGYITFLAGVGGNNTCHYLIYDALGNWEVGLGTLDLTASNLTRTTVLASSNSGAAVSFPSGTKQVWIDVPAAMLKQLASPWADPGGRLTLTSGLPVTVADVTSTTVYYTPWNHNVIHLWDGNLWQVCTYSEQSLALGTVTAALPYDIFGFLSSGTLALEKLAWTNTTTRATTVTLQDGRYCKNGDKTRLYLGTIYTSSTTQTKDTFVNRFVWNQYNRVRKPVAVNDAAASWVYTVATYRQANANALNQIEVVVGQQESLLDLMVHVETGNTGAGIAVFAGVGEDSTSAVDTSYQHGGKAASYATVTLPIIARYIKNPAIGYHKYCWLEKSTAAGTTTWFNNGDAPFGMHGFWEC